MAIVNSNPPKKGQALNFPISLTNADTGRIKTNPNIAAGDFKVTVDGVAFGNMDTLPEVLPTGGDDVMIYLSAAETDGHTIKVTWKDQTVPPEWEDGWQTILTTA